MVALSLSLYIYIYIYIYYIAIFCRAFFPFFTLFMWGERGEGRKRGRSCLRHGTDYCGQGPRGIFIYIIYIYIYQVSCRCIYCVHYIYVCVYIAYTELDLVVGVVNRGESEESCWLPYQSNGHDGSTLYKSIYIYVLTWRENKEEYIYSTLFVARKYIYRVYIP